MALEMSAAATAESTPPDSPQITRASPTCSLISATFCSARLAMVQSPAAPQASRANRRKISAPWSVWDTSG